MENLQNLIEDAIAHTEEKSRQKTDGKWLEELTIRIAPYIREWDIDKCYSWADWPERTVHFPNTTRGDIGIDAVAVRRSDGSYIAIQCKSRQLDEYGHGQGIYKDELDKFIAASATGFWADRWLVTNGDAPVSSNIARIPGLADKRILPVNIYIDLLLALCSEQSQNSTEGQTKQSMQDEAVYTAVRILREHEFAESGGLPVGEARGRIILPCGTGKTRISLRIIERLTPAGSISIVLCPSIALVAQIRREYLDNTVRGIKILAVCSDETAGYDPRKEGTLDISQDPTADSSYVSASAIKGEVTTSAVKIGEWITTAKQQHSGIGVVIGTYQSGHRIAEALQSTKTTARVLICDEAHRTAGLRKDVKPGINQKLRNFTICHDNDTFPATYRVYQTATPRVYRQDKVRRRPEDWLVRSMDDESVFGVELFRRSYMDAVNNGWLADYRIIAIGINSRDTYAAANQLARNTRSRGRLPLTPPHFIRGLALSLAMSNAIRESDGAEQLVPIRSCIAFMNTVDKSRNMVKDLQSDVAKEWMHGYLSDNHLYAKTSRFYIEHLDATSNVERREQAKANLARATISHPHAILNVGIFGEGTDTPSLSAVAFLEPRKSPVDVIQAVGRVMRTSPGKGVGYIICPIEIPLNKDPEAWLEYAHPEDGWKELGQILLALRAHDTRIEDRLSELIKFSFPSEQGVTVTAVSLASRQFGAIRHFYHVGRGGEARKAAIQVVKQKSSPEDAGLYSLDELEGKTRDPFASLSVDNVALSDIDALQTTHQNADGTVETRTASPDLKKRGRRKAGTAADIQRIKSQAADMINNRKGEPYVSRGKRPYVSREENMLRQLSLVGLDEIPGRIQMNLLAKSGLKGNKVDRDLNILRECVEEASRHLREDGLLLVLNRHFQVEHLGEDKGNDSCQVAALQLLNAAMLHQRIAVGGWLDISNLSQVKNDVNVVERLSREWEHILSQDFEAILEPALDILEAIEHTGKVVGLERCLRYIAQSAEEIAVAYADMGTDHAGPIFNEFMGNQASDGAFFTRPVAASISARLALDVCGDLNWNDKEVWREHKIVDLACGSGTLLAAMLTDMKRRARKRGAGDDRIAELQKLAVEDTIKGLDITAISLQLAASQLTASTKNIQYRRMGLHLMPYGPRPSASPLRVDAGTLALLGQKEVVNRSQDLGPEDEKIASQSTWAADDAKLENVMDAVRDIRIVIMNPPYTSRSKMGEKFEGKIQKALRESTDALEKILVRADPAMEGFVDKNSIGPLFVALADHILKQPDGVVAMINPTIALSTPSGLRERELLAGRFHIHTVLTCHQPKNFHLSQNTSINESIIVMRRQGSDSPKPDTRFIHLDRMPIHEGEVEELHRCLLDCDEGLMSNGWGEVSYWTSGRMSAGDWTPAVWRSPELAEASYKYANHPDLGSIREADLLVWATGRLLRGSFERTEPGVPGSFPILKSKGADAQTTIQSQPDEHWIPKNLDEEVHLINDLLHTRTSRILEKAGHLLITAGQDTGTGRLTAVASDQEYVGNGWIPVTGVSVQEAKSLAVFINSTAGRLQLMRNPGKKLPFPAYSVAEVKNLRIPDVKDDHIRETLANCWEHTRDMQVPQYRDGECEVRQLWDDAVAEAMGWDASELDYLRGLLNREPHVRGTGYNQYISG